MMRWVLDMSIGHWLIVFGWVALLVGLAATFLTLYYADKVMGRAKRGIAVWAPEEDSPAMAEKKRGLQRADFWFYVGLTLTGIGITLQTVGALLE